AAFGSLWGACYGDGTLLQIDPATNAVVATTPVGAGLDGLVAHAGSLWAVADKDGTVSKFDPSTARITATLAMPSEPRNPAFGAGSLWVAGFAEDVLFRIELG